MFTILGYTVTVELLLSVISLLLALGFVLTTVRQISEYYARTNQTEVVLSAVFEEDSPLTKSLATVLRTAGNFTLSMLVQNTWRRWKVQRAIATRQGGEKDYVVMLPAADAAIIRTALQNHISALCGSAILAKAMGLPTVTVLAHAALVGEPVTSTGQEHKARIAIASDARLRDTRAWTQLEVADHAQRLLTIAQMHALLTKPDESAVFCPVELCFVVTGGAMQSARGDEGALTTRVKEILEG